MTRSEWLATLEQERMDTSYKQRERMARFPKLALSVVAVSIKIEAFHAGRYFEGSRDPWATQAWSVFDHKADLVTEARKNR